MTIFGTRSTSARSCEDRKIRDARVKRRQSRHVCAGPSCCVTPPSASTSSSSCASRSSRRRPHCRCTLSPLRALLVHPPAGPRDHLGMLGAEMLRFAPRIAGQALAAQRTEDGARASDGSGPRDVRQSEPGGGRCRTRLTSRARSSAALPASVGIAFIARSRLCRAVRPGVQPWRDARRAQALRARRSHSRAVGLPHDRAARGRLRNPALLLAHARTGE